MVKVMDVSRKGLSGAAATVFRKPDAMGRNLQRPDAWARRGRNIGTNPNSCLELVQTNGIVGFANQLKAAGLP
jgi:hypothetical protein